ncbi:divalent-cation tolerance protein CutA [Candidatus Binatia bacterium]|nr:divalent-cation tolerance protein CutA [Candidatus Binatia bacterium]
MTDCIVVLVTVGTAEDGTRMARALVDDRLAACVNVVGPIRSIYRWDGQVCDDAEHLLVIKTRAALFAATTARIRAMHPYETPEIVALPITDGSEPYLAWLRGATPAAVD